MSTQTDSIVSDDIIARLAAIVGHEHLVTDAATRRVYGTDIFYAVQPPIAVASPGNVAELAELVRIATTAGLTLAPRGGGLSYSKGYLTDRPDTLLLDLQRLNRIVEINKRDMYVHVEGGVTWEQLDTALKEHDLRTPYWGTGSGLRATVGGSLSQNSVNYGSGQYGTAAESVLALNVVTADGEQLRTGSWATADNPSPFTRYYGPDLTGLFLGDNGALGVKAEAVLQLMPRPKAVRYVAYGFDSREILAGAMADVGHHALASEAFGMDPFFLSERIVSTGFADDVQKLLGVARGQASVVSGLKEAFKVAAAGRRHLRDVGYSLHMAVEGRNAADADNSLEQINSICSQRGGREIAASVSRVMRGTPFPPPYMLLGPKGERWVPVHGIVPHSRHVDALAAIDTFMNEQAESIERFGIEWGQVSLLVGRSRVLIEVNMYWPDARTAMIESYLDDDFLKSKQTYEPNPQALAAISGLRRGLGEVFRDLGSSHLQVGRHYPFLESRTPELRRVLSAIKALLDPHSQMNPGVLGLE